MTWAYSTCCVHARGKDIDEMVDAATEIKYLTIRKAIGAVVLDEWAREHSYDVGHMREGLRLKDDWHVTYHKSHYKKRRCYYIQHSGIEYIFTEIGG